MQHALALAEFRLSSLFRAHRELCAGAERPHGNVFYLETFKS
jgi:hypothetical protein